MRAERSSQVISGTGLWGSNASTSRCTSRRYGPGSGLLGRKGLHTAEKPWIEVLCSTLRFKTALIQMPAVHCFVGTAALLVCRIQHVGPIQSLPSLRLSAEPPEIKQYLRESFGQKSGQDRSEVLVVGSDDSEMIPGHGRDLDFLS